MTAASLVPQRALVLGLGITGRAVARALVARGGAVTVTDDRLGAQGPAVAAELGATWADPPADWDGFLEAFDGVLPSPGVPERHPVFAASLRTGVPIRTEFDLAAAWDHRPVAFITGTDGKTTVTMLVTDMLLASGLNAVPAGNVDVPLVEAIDDPAVDVFVVEASSFRLTFSTGHRPTVATWLNLAPDHLDVHLDLAGYEAAKAQLWANHAAGGLAVANADDPTVLRHAPPGDRTQTFSIVGPADWYQDHDVLRGPGGVELLPVAELTRALPHDRANALAAAATALGVGASLDGIRSALRAFRSLPHRVELVGEAGGVSWYDDSKATAPHATVAAMSGFASAVLIAGGHNKGLDLRELVQVVPHLRAVVAIGDAAPEVVHAFAGAVPITVATSMDQAVAQAAAAAREGDAVVLSPACASFDWYRSYGERGDDFQRAVRAHLEAAS